MITVGTKIIVDPEKSASRKLLILLRDRPCLELIIVSSNSQALLFVQVKLLEPVWKLLASEKKSLKVLDPPFPELIQ